MAGPSKRRSPYQRRFRHAIACNLPPGEPGGLTGVIAAMRLERAAARPLERAGWLVAHSGVGAERAREAAAILLAAGCKRLLVWGTAGGLASSLRPGTLLLPATVIGPDGSRYAADAAWRACLRRRLPAHLPVSEETLVTCARPLGTQGEKEAWAQRTGAVAVDLEAGAVAALAAERGTAFAVLRAVADPLELDIPRAVLGAAGTRWLVLGIALRLLVRPTDLGGVLRLRRAYLPARRTLEQTARAVTAAQG